MDNKFWKIPKEWIQEWHLSAIECIVLADATEWECPIVERAERCGVAERTVRNTLAGLTEKAVKITALSDLLKAVRITAKSGKNYRIQNGKNYRLKRQNLPLETAKLTANLRNTPHTPYKEYTDNKDNGDKCARASEKPENFSGKNLSAAEPAPTPQPPAPTAPDSVLVKRVSEWEQEHRTMIAQGSEWANSIYRLYKITSLQLNDYLTQFTDHCTAQGEEYKTLTDYRKHLTSWLRYRATNNTTTYARQTTPQQRREITRSTEPAGADF